MEEEKLKVVIEADASNTEEESNKAIRALQRVRDTFQAISKSLKINAGKAAADVASSVSESVTSSANDKEKEVIAQLEKQVADLKKQLDKSGTGAKALEIGLRGALISLRLMNSAMSMIRKGMQYYLSQNDALQAKLNGIYYALGSMMAPVIEWIINLFAKLLAFVNALLQGLGFAGIKFKAMGKAASGAAKQMKQLAGFDELNNLSSDSGGGGGGGGAGMTNPLEGIDESAKWLKFARDYAKEILDIFLLIVGTIGLMKLGFSAIGALGLTTTLLGIYKIVTGIADMINNGINADNLLQVIEGISLAVMGLAALFGGWVTVAIAGIVLLVTKICQHSDKAKEWINNAIENVKEWWTNLKTRFSEDFASIGEWWHTLWGNIKDWFNTQITQIKDKFTEIKDKIRNDFSTAIENGKEKVRDFAESVRNKLKDMWEKIKGMFSKGGEGFKSITEGLSSTLKSWLNRLIDGINKVIYTPLSKVQSMLYTLRNWSFAGITPFRNLPYIYIPQIPRLATGGFPEDGLFMANSGELVGKFSNGNTAVVNNEQIIEGIKRGVIDAMMEVNSRDNNSDGVVNLYLDGTLLTRQIVNNINYMERVQGVKLV